MLHGSTKSVRLNVCRVTRLSERCQIELRLTVEAVTEDDVKTVLKCVTQNQAGRQEVTTQLQFEGEPSCLDLFLNAVISILHSC